MKHSTSLPLFYACLLLFTIFVVFFEEHEEGTFHMMEYTSDINGGFRSPKIWDQLTIEIPEVNNETIKQMSPVEEEEEEGGRRRDAAPAVYLEEMPKEFCFLEEGLDLHDKKLKKILIWNAGYGTKTMGFGYGHAPFQRAQCEVNACMTTSNASLVPVTEFDAVIFHFRATEKNKMPTVRSPHQRWIFEEVESSSYIYQDPAKYNGLFNWTMTYRRDSDIVYTYGRVYPSSSPSPVPKDKNFAEGKTKMAAWFVSNCYSHSKREKIVKGLKKFIEVDIYGKCGPNKCSRKDTRQCYQMLEENYKFYLSFENSLCQDYVTEKLFSVLKYNVIPIVYGRADYALIAPPGSYINALEFPTVESLANYLKYLDGNDTAYNEYFRWKGRYVIDNGWSNTAQGFCDLCKKLHQDEAPKIYRDIKDWFMLKGNCKTLRSRSWLPWL